MIETGNSGSRDITKAKEMVGERQVCEAKYSKVRR